MADNGGTDSGHKLSACCISHEFVRAASKSPDKIAVIQAAGFAKIAEEFHRNRKSDRETSVSESSSLFNPPVYDGDNCFTFSEVLSAVEKLSFRLRGILDSADDPYLFRAHLDNIPDQNSGHTNSSGPEENSMKFQDMHTPKIVGIYMEPSVEYIVALLSILRCGEAFMPLDPTWPKARILSVIASSKCDLVIGCESSANGNCFHWLDKVQWLIDSGCCCVLPISMNDKTNEPHHFGLVSWHCESKSLRSFCYLMYTSGSTGKPKGVCGTEIGLLNRFLWMQQHYPLHGGDLSLFKTSISFIDHLQELLGPLLSTCTLVIPPFNQLKENLFYLVDYLQGYSINRLVAVPSLMRAILPALQSPCYGGVQKSLKLLVLSGEVLHLSLQDMLANLLPKSSILNLYGSTEVAGDCTYFDCKELPLILKNERLESVPIGLPISNCNVMLVGEDAPNQGEIYVNGLCTVAGYFCYPHLMPLEHIEFTSDIQYKSDHAVLKYFKTGDFARKLESGDLVFLGRKDRIIKVSGQRVALEEVESVLREHPDVVDAAVVCHEVEGKMKLLEGHLVIKEINGDNEILQSAIKEWMVNKLPTAMIPSRIFFAKSLPLSSSGKVDYRLLAASSDSIMHAQNDDGDLMQTIIKVFSGALGVEKISEDDDFFGMGGNSISAAYVSFKLGIQMKLLYVFPTPLKLYEALLSSEHNPTDAHAEVQLDENANAELKIRAYKSKPHARSFEAQNVEDADNPVKHLKTTPNLCICSNVKDDFWSLSPTKMSCSFSRCNKILHGPQCENNSFCHTTWSKEISEDGRGSMQELWKVNLGSCIDASPLLVFKETSIYLFIGSHSYRFTCIDAKSGAIHWEIKLQGRIECSAAILDDLSQVVVGCYQGIIYFLDFADGSISWSFQTCGEVKSQPVVDKCRHLVWCGSYDHNLYALDYKNYCCIFKLPCGGSIYGSPAIDEMRDKLYVASTSGSLAALSIKDFPFSKLWKLELGTPIFGSISVICSTGNVICCLVDGTVLAMDISGSVVWKGRTNGPNFAGPCISLALPSQVLICSRDGSIYSFEMDTGQLLWEHNVGHPITSSPYVDENLRLTSGTSCLSDRLVCVCDSSGNIYVLQVKLNALEDLNQKKGMVEEFARFKIEGDIFSSPVMVCGRIFVGCRDDNVYCIKLIVK